MSILQILLERDGIPLPKGGRAEKAIKCFMPGHDDGSPSMSVNVAKSVYFCHGCEAKGNAYTYLTDVRGLGKAEATKILVSLGATKENLSHYQSTDKKNKEERAKKRSGLPKTAEAPYECLGAAILTATYNYYAPDDLVDQKHPIIVQRWEEKLKDKKTGEPKTKKTLLTFLKRTEGDYWVTKPDNENIPPEDRVSPVPLYGIEQAKPVIDKGRKVPDAQKPQVWVVEGEKCRDAVASIRNKKPPPCVSPYGGSSRPIGTTDWSPLYGQRVLLIADADKTGRNFMKSIGRHLYKNNASVKYFLPKGETGYDIFDALVEDDWTSMMAWINEHGGVQEYEVVHPPKGGDEKDIEAPPLDDCQFFTVHGYEGDNVVIQDKETHYMHKILAKGLTHEGQLLCLAPRDFWMNLAPNRKLTTDIRSMWADKIIRAAKNKGAITTNNMKLYELGAAITENGEIVYNVGDHLLVEDEQGILTNTKPLLFSGQGREIYLPGPKIRMMDDPSAKQWADELASAILRYRWEDVEHGRYFVGWIVSSLVGGALGFRPMVWMIGDAGTGKTFLLDEVLKKLMGTLLTDVGSGSEAGLAAMSGNASLPFYIDEFEPEKAKEGAMSQTLSLMRIASGGGQARVRGTASGGTVIRRPRFSLLVSSINRPNLDSASESRISMIKLSEVPVPDWPSVRDSIHASLTNERALAIRTFIIRNTARVVRKAKEIEDKMIAQHVPTRTAKTMAALTAGHWLLSGKETGLAIQKRKKADNLAPLMCMLSAIIRVGNTDMALSECLYQAYFEEDGRWKVAADDDEDQKLYKKACWRYGFGFIEEGVIEPELIIALNLDTRKQLLSKSKFENIDIDEYLLNLPGAERLQTKSGNPKRIRVAGTQKPVVKIPEEIMEKIGFTNKSDDFVSDENLKDEDLPF